MPQYRVVRTWTVTHEISVDAADETEAELEAGAMLIGVEGRLWAAFKGSDGMIEIEEDEPEIEDV